jgi:hypothetical protein
VRALRRDHIKVAHKDPRNSSLKENLLKTASNPMKKSLKIPPKILKKKNGGDKRILHKIKKK